MATQIPSGGITADNMEAMFKQAQARNMTDDLKMTEEETEKFTKAFQDPEFRKMMAEYVDEISDPKNREEQEAYIRQMETDGNVPAGKEAVHPKAGYVVKTHKTDKGKKPEKVWVNIVHHEKVDEPTFEATERNGVKGTAWRLPHSLGPPRMEKDKRDGVVTTFDCCFHPRAVAMTLPGGAARDTARLREVLVNTALEAVENGARAQGQPNYTLDREFHVLKGVDYKVGAQPQTMLFPKNPAPVEVASRNGAGAKGGAKARRPRRARPRPRWPSPARPRPRAPRAAAGSAASRASSRPSPSPRARSEPTGPVEPSFTIVERGVFDMAKHFGGASLPRADDGRRRGRPSSSCASRCRASPRSRRSSSTSRSTRSRCRRARPTSSTRGCRTPCSARAPPSSTRTRRS